MTIMNIPLKKLKTKKPPVLLRGLFFNILFIVGLILVFCWIMISTQVEQLITTRTSEYAHSIAKIAADSSAEAVLANDKLQLSRLAESITKVPYIKSVIIFAEDGQILIQYPNTSESITEVNTLTFEEKDDTYIHSKNDLPFIEKIIYQGVTSGWFKIVIDRNKLENTFFQSINHSKNIILLTSIFLLSLLFILIYRYHQRVQSLVTINHRLLQINTPQIHSNKKEWMDAIYQLCQTQYQQSFDNKQLSSFKNNWSTSKRVNSNTFCFCQFSIAHPENEETSIYLNQANIYIQAAIHSHGVSFQGSILSGYLIPFIKKNNNQEILAEIISLIYIIKQLLNYLPYRINMKTVIARGDIMAFENDNGETSGFLLFARTAKKINQILAISEDNDIYCINIERTELGSFGDVKLGFKDLKFPNLQLVKINHSIQQQANRQVMHLKQNNCII